MNNYFNFEIYTSDPITGTTGWEIKSISVKAESGSEAMEKLKEFPNFDVVIMFNFKHKENESANYLVTDFYPCFKITERV